MRGGVLLDEVTGARDRFEACARDARDEFAPLVDGDPGVVLAPAHQGRDRDLAVPVLHFVGVALVGLGDLTVEGRLARVAEPGFDQPVEDGGVQAGAAGGADVLADEGPVQGGRQLVEDVGVLADEPEERRPPRGQRDRVDQESER